MFMKTHELLRISQDVVENKAGNGFQGNLEMLVVQRPRSRPGDLTVRGRIITRELRGRHTGLVRTPLPSAEKSISIRDISYKSKTYLTYVTHF